MVLAFAITAFLMFVTFTVWLARYEPPTRQQVAVRRMIASTRDFARAMSSLTAVMQQTGDSMRRFQVEWAKTRTP